MGVLGNNELLLADHHHARRTTREYHRPMYHRPAVNGTAESHLRDHLRDSLGNRVLVHRRDLDDLLLQLTSLREQPPPDGCTHETDGVVLSEADHHVELLAQASWDSCPRERVDRYGKWDDLHDDDPRRQATLDGARRTLHYLLTGEALPEDSV